MLQWVRNLPSYAEFIIVIFLCIGGYIAYSAWVIIAHEAPTIWRMWSDGEFIGLATQRSAALFAVALFLSVRGWSFEDIKFSISWRSSLGGLLIVFIFTALYAFLDTLFPDGDNSEDHQMYETALIFSLAYIIYYSVFYPIFEELIVVGYVMNFIAYRHGPVIAIGVSTMIRALYHSTQGPMSLLWVIPMGVLFGLIYWRWRNLWPLILAHCVLTLGAHLLVENKT